MRRSRSLLLLPLLLGFLPAVSAAAGEIPVRGRGTVSMVLQTGTNQGDIQMPTSR